VLEWNAKGAIRETKRFDTTMNRYVGEKTTEDVNSGLSIGTWIIHQPWPSDPHSFLFFFLQLLHVTAVFKLLDIELITVV
jgi:hypothetical protein